MMQVQRVAIISSDEGFNDETEVALNDKFNVSRYFSFSRFVQMLQYNKPDVIVLDAENQPEKTKLRIQRLKDTLGEVPLIVHGVTQDLVDVFKKKKVSAIIPTETENPIAKIEEAAEVLGQTVATEKKFPKKMRMRDKLHRFFSRL